MSYKLEQNCLLLGQRNHQYQISQLLQQLIRSKLLPFIRFYYFIPLDSRFESIKIMVVVFFQNSPKKKIGDCCYVIRSHFFLQKFRIYLHVYHKINMFISYLNFSNITSSCFWFLTLSMATLILSPTLVALVTLVSNLNFSPCFWRIRWKFLATSKSIPMPPMFDKNSTQVTSDPYLCHTDP